MGLWRPLLHLRALPLRRRLMRIAPDSIVQEDFSDPELSPPQWTLVLHPDGSGHFRSHMEPKTGMKVIEAPNVDRDIQVSKDFAGRAFDNRETPQMV